MAPSGTYTVFDGTTQLSGSVSTSGFTVPPAGQVYFNGTIQTTLSAPSGPHALKARYSDDANYASSDSSAVTVNAVYATTLGTSLNPSNNIILGDSVVFTFTVRTGQPASNAALKPTGTISYNFEIESGSGSVATTAGQDASGNWVLQGTVTLKPQQPDHIIVNYSGDSNYAPSGGPTYVPVTIPDFSLSASSAQLTITAGQTGTTTVTITPRQTTQVR